MQDGAEKHYQYHFKCYERYSFTATIGKSQINREQYGENRLFIASFYIAFHLLII